MIENINIERSTVSAELHGYLYDAVYNYTGVFSYGSALEAEILSNNEVKIKDGLLCNAGRFLKVAGSETLKIENGTSGVQRIDLIVAHFETDGITETHDLRVIKGAPGDTMPPDYTSGDIYAGDTINEAPLYYVKLDGLTITEVKQAYKRVYSANELSRMSNPNLLINGDFRINQRGQTEYTQTTSWKYSLDRWKYIGIMTVKPVETGGVVISKTNNSADTYFAQELEHQMKGPATLSFEVTSIQGTMSVYMEGTGEKMLEVKKSGVYSIYSEIGAKDAIFRLDGTSTTAILKWVKLEAGPVATPNEPRLPGEELMLCKRYYEENEICLTPIVGTIPASYYLVVNGCNFEVEKRVQPNVTFGTFYINTGETLDVTVKEHAITKKYIRNIGFAQATQAYFLRTTYTADAEIY